MVEEEEDWRPMNGGGKAFERVEQLGELKLWYEYWQEKDVERCDLLGFVVAVASIGDIFLGCYHSTSRLQRTDSCRLRARVGVMQKISILLSRWDLTFCGFVYRALLLSG